MTSKTDILARIRRHQPAATPLPDLNGPWIAYADRQQQFIEVLAFVGGYGAVVADRAELELAIQQLPCFADAARIACTVPGIALGNCDLAAAANPGDVADVDLAILPGELAVAENGAVWVTDRALKHRAIYFLTQHLVLVVPRAALVDHLHQAYDRLHLEGSGYGLFISGPSKTADIEQSLVIGAHGPRSLSVFLLDSGSV